MHQDGVWACLRLIRYCIHVITVYLYSEMNIDDIKDIYVVLFRYALIQILINCMRCYIIVN